MPAEILTTPYSLRENGEVCGWESVDATTFNVRGKEYLQDRVKIPSSSSAFKLVDFSGISAAEKVPFTTDLADSYTERAMSQGRKGFIFTVHFDLSGCHVVLSFELIEEVLEGDPAFAACWRRFLQGDDKYKSERLKLITSVVEASWIVRKAIGKPVPVLIGNKLKTHWKQTPNSLECTVDVTSSMAATAIVAVVKPAARSVVLDLVLLIEGRAEDELPERVIGVARCINHDFSKYPPLLAATTPCETGV